VQRWMSRGLFAGSPTIDIGSPRRRARPAHYLGHELGEAPLQWVFAAMDDTVSVRRTQCAECEEPGFEPSAAVPSVCEDCVFAATSPFGRGGGTPINTRRHGGGHAVVMQRAHEEGIDLSLADPLERNIRLLSALVLGNNPSYAVWTQVYPTGQAGARQQETPSSAVAAAAVVIRASLSSVIDRDWLVTELRPENARRALAGLPDSTPMMAFDASGATDGERHEVIEGAVARGSPVYGFKDWSEDPHDPVDLRAMALERYLRYESVTMSPAEWAARAAGGQERAYFSEPLAARSGTQRTVELLVGGESRRLALGDTILVIDGPTGCGKTRLAMDLDRQVPTAIGLPTRVAILSGGADAARHTGRPTGVVFYQAGLAADADAGPTRTGAAVFDSSWSAATRAEALACRRTLVTPYQMRARVDMSEKVVILDEVHERDWERMMAVAAAVLRGAEFIAISATLPSFLRDTTLAGRPIERQSLPGPQLLVSVEKTERAVSGAGLRVFGSVKECLAAGRIFEEPVLHGLLSASETAHVLQQAAAGATICATRGVVASAVTLGDVRWISLDRSVRHVVRYRLGSGTSYRTEMTE
jgi:hypothetical protein